MTVEQKKAGLTKIARQWLIQYPAFAKIKSILWEFELDVKGSSIGEPNTAHIPKT